MLELLSTSPNLYFMWVTIVVFSVCCHEYAHAQVALWQGDSTAADNGHLTLNPLKQMGWLSLILLFLVGLAWGAVPVNPSRMRHRYSSALVSSAGPLMNLLLFTGFTVLAAFAHNMNMDGAVRLFMLGSCINIVLFIFNMLPVPILDGYTVFSFLFPKINMVNPELKNGLTFLLVIILFCSFNQLWRFGFWITGQSVDALLYLI